MTPSEFRAIRESLGLTLDQFGEALGYTGEKRRQQIYEMEHGNKNITLPVGRLAEMYGIPKGWVIKKITGDETLVLTRAFCPHTRETRRGQ